MNKNTKKVHFNKTGVYIATQVGEQPPVPTITREGGPIQVTPENTKDKGRTTTPITKDYGNRVRGKKSPRDLVA